mgnify:CR=1 FL=1
MQTKTTDKLRHIRGITVQERLYADSAPHKWQYITYSAMSQPHPPFGQKIQLRQRCLSPFRRPRLSEGILIRIAPLSLSEIHQTLLYYHTIHGKSSTFPEKFSFFCLLVNFHTELYTSYTHNIKRKRRLHHVSLFPEKHPFKIIGLRIYVL